MKITLQPCAIAVVVVVLFAGQDQSLGARPAKSQMNADGLLRIESGMLTIQFDQPVLEAHGLSVDSRHGETGPDVGFTLEAPLRSISEIEVATRDRLAPEIRQARFIGDTGFMLLGEGVSWALAPLELDYDELGWRFVDQAGGDSGGTPSLVTEVVAQELADGRLRVVGDLFLAPGSITGALADHIHIGSFSLDVSFASKAADPTVAAADVPAGRSAEPPAGGVAAVIGPDVLVDLIGDVKRWGRVGTITGYSLLTKACNIGDEPVDWIAGTTTKPVISQGMFRLKDGQMEQIGMAWIKHAFFADDEVCSSGGTCIPDPMGRHLGPNCGDTYLTGPNGDQFNLGPRWEINPTLGTHLWPFAAQGIGGDDVYKRIQVQDVDIDPDDNPSALYFVESQYISPDDAAANNQDNNASYAPVTVQEPTPNIYNVIGPAGNTTVIGKPTIMAWEDTDPEVTTVAIDIPGDRRVFLAHKVTDLGGGLWHYEYAIQNLNSDRAIGSFTVPIDDEAAVSNIGFHDIDSHSGDESNPAATYYSTVDWVGSLGNGELHWAADSFATDERANAIHWGLLYNFRFDSTQTPVMGLVTLGLFKPGTPDAMTVAAWVPGTPLALMASDPPDGAIDARQPSDLDGSNPTGWDRVAMTFSGSVAGLIPGDFAVTQQGGLGAAPGVLSVDVSGPETATVVLDAIIEVGARTTITHSPSGGSVTLGYLPGDVNADAVSAPSDILAVIDALNGVGPPRAIWSTDIDRSGVAGPEDILRVIDLLNGAAAFEPFLDRTLP